MTPSAASGGDQRGRGALGRVARREPDQGDEAAQEQPLRDQVDPVSGRAAGGQRLVRAEERQQVRAADGDQPAHHTRWRTEAIADQARPKEARRHNEDLQHASILAPAAAHRLAVDRNAQSLRSTT